ncbi:restriction endonuclease subunit S [Microbacterium binotii]|uniref:Type I restriction modification DNA specificity domain-containing protein n=1 Tax=Microbacterium binotii TaxID=462710 RepID=A0ABN3PAV8_9MICO
MRRVALGELTERVQTWNPTGEPDREFTYVDLSAVDNVSKTITGGTLLRGADAPSRARQLISNGDVLVSTVRPNLNSVALVPPTLDGATASTGFSVLRPNSALDGRYLFHWVRSPEFVNDMVRRATGASYPAVSDRIVKSSLIPLPPLPEQRRIAAILDRADMIRAKRHRVLEHLNEAPAAVFRDMFAHEDAAGAVSEFANNVRTGPFGSQLRHGEFVDEGIAVLGLDNVVGNEFRWGARRYITPAKYEQLKRYTVAPGDVLISIMGTTGRCVVVPDGIPRAINTKHICAISVDRTHLEPTFLRAAFLWHPLCRTYLARQTKGSIMDGLNMGIIKSMPIPAPALTRQREFADRVAELDQCRSAVQAANRLDEKLISSLQSRAFRGEL